MIFIRRNDPSRFSRNTKKSQKWLIRKIAATDVLIPNCPVKMFNTLVSWSNFLYSYKCNCPKLLWNVTKIRDIKVNPNCSNMCWRTIGQVDGNVTRRGEEETSGNSHVSWNAKSYKII